MTHPLQKCHISAFADYYQFYVLGEKDVIIPTDWTEDDIASRVKVAPSLVVVCPLRNMEVPVSVEIWEKEPNVIFDQWQHVVEAPLASNGTIIIDECTGTPKAEFAVEPGDYTVRCLFRGLTTISEDGLDGEDSYVIQIWKGICPKLRITKMWNNP